MESKDPVKRELEKMARALEGAADEELGVVVAAMYKGKDKKVRPVDANDGTGDPPGGRYDWYERSKARECPQEHVGVYRDYLLPRITSIPRGSRLTPERLKALEVGNWLWENERAMFDEMMINREGAIAFDWKEVSKIHEDVSPPIVIKTVPHEAWQEKNFPCPRALVPVVVKMLIERLERGVLEKCDGPYRNPWFLVAKKTAGTYRLINAAMKMNSVTLRDANLPPSVDEFSEEFAGCACASLIDFFSGYDQLTLDKRSRDMTAFMTPLGLLRMTTPPQGATNSVAQFVRVVMTILEDLFPKIAMPFIDDIGVKGPYTDYGGALILPGIRRFVFEHIQNLDKTMDRIERAGATIGPKSQFCYDGMIVVGFVCGSKGRAPEAAKVSKILNWEYCKDVTEAKAFLGICVYYRIWIKDFIIIAEPIYRLQRKGVGFEWGQEQMDAMSLLQEALTSAPLLCKLHYDPAEGWGMIVLAVDASLDGWGGTLGQFDPEGHKRVARYESGVWNEAEKRYDAGKRECRGVLKALQKTRFWLYGTHFILELDANTLVAQLNRAATDLPGALVTRWLAWIQLFDFEVRHVKGAKHGAADGLSRRPHFSDDSEDDIDIDEFVADELEAVGIGRARVRFQKGKRAVVGSRAQSLDFCHVTNRDQYGGIPGVSLMSLSSKVTPSEELRTVEIATERRRGRSMGLTEDPQSAPDQVTADDDEDHSSSRSSQCDDFRNPLTDDYSEHFQEIARYLTTLAKPEGMNRAAFRRLKNEALKYSVRDRQLWKNSDKTKIYPPRLVVSNKEKRTDIIRELHDKTGHAGRESTYHRIAMRYYWEGCYDEVRRYVSSCKECQHRSKLRQEEALFPTKAAPLFHCIGIDVVKLPERERYDCLVVARDDFSGWVEAKPMKQADSRKVARFIWEDLICRHGLFGKLKVDGGSEFKKDVIKELEKYGIHRVVISAYNSKANGMIERGHQPLIAALIALTNGGRKSWVPFLRWVLFADRTTIHRPTGFTPFYMVYGREAVLPVETKYPTWRTLGWDEVHDRSTLLELRARQLMMRDEDIEEARLKKDRRRYEGKENFDLRHQIRPAPIKEGDLVLAYDIKLIDQDMSKNTKLQYRWRGPFRVKRANQEKGYYSLEELDGSEIRQTYAGNRLKRFVQRDGYWYSPEDEVSDLTDPGTGIPFRTGAELEEEAIQEFHEKNSALEAKRGPRVIVNLPGLSESEKAKYVAFSDSENEGSTEEMAEGSGMESD